MTRLKFNDGIEFDTDGGYRIERRKDSYYVVGNGFMCPAADHDEAKQILADLKEYNSGG
jgi:hypothetical protein